MKNHIFYIIVALLITQLSGCASTTYQLTDGEQEAKDNQQQTELNQWQLTGKLGIKSDKKAQSINLLWQQQGKNYQLRLNGPIGFGAATISGDQQQAKIQQGSHTFTGSPDQLGLRLLRVPLSVDAMSWWVKGLISPNHSPASDIVLQDDGHLSSFQQNGWQLKFSGYHTNGPYTLPKKISGRLGELSFKLVISSWNYSK